ncbi:MAG: bifunctional diaminohydroxyphosphoribosylaminopyrimidine deaminase/5-amino-6-(5-phosphoribosylamino)uracil reductase RibD [bacterium]|nr:bifunctional diaminohydroxyphosphoribosylaminopyrimidine deaminase/5-amino-6-(5-phosphoribosylamino)uracil reductase RibD [bacterium]
MISCTETADLKFMNLALKLSRKAVGFTEPNPLVGAVAVIDNQLVGTGYHHMFGSHHAEREALKDVPPGATLYVTLEPCCHFGKTPPCCRLVVEKKVKRVVVALQDPNPKVNGKGVEELRKNDILVEVGLLSHMARKINRHYIKYITGNVPYLALRAGVSTDGKLTDNFRKAQWITGKELRTYSHALRGEFGALLAGAGTVRDDNPGLNIRQEGWENKKLFRVILDSTNSLPRNLKIFRDQQRFPTIVFSSQDAQDKTAKLEHHFFIPAGETGLDLQVVLETLHGLGIASVMVEGGGAVINSFLTAGLYDEIILFQAPTLIGGKQSVECFATGTHVSTPVVLEDREIITLETGQIIRSFRNV